MEIIILILSILIIAIVLLQSGKSEGASSIITGGNSDMMVNRKERGGELFITRLTAVLGALFLILCVYVEFFG